MKKSIAIEIAKQRLKAFEGDKEIFNFPCVTADGKHKTPIGKFKVLKKERVRRSAKYNAQMNYALQLTSDGIFIHESYNYIEDPKEQSGVATVISDSTANIMSAMRAWMPTLRDTSLNFGSVNLMGSHGCIRLAHSDAVRLFDWAEKDMPVRIN